MSISIMMRLERMESQLAEILQILRGQRQAFDGLGALYPDTPQAQLTEEEYKRMAELQATQFSIQKKVKP